jgi:hypothetical protein
MVWCVGGHKIESSVSQNSLLLAIVNMLHSVVVFFFGSTYYINIDCIYNKFARYNQKHLHCQHVCNC